MKRKSLLLWLIAMMLVPQWGFAQASQFSNETCSYEGDPTAATTSWQTVSGTLPDGNTYHRYDFQLFAGREYTFSLCTDDGGSATFDTYMALYGGGYGCFGNSAANSDYVAYNDDDCSTRSRFTYTPTTDGWRSLYITGYGSNFGDYTLAYKYGDAPEPPVNVTCSTATLLPCGTEDLAGTTQYTTGVAHNTGASVSNYGVWYTFTGDGGETTITVTPSTSNYDIRLVICKGSCNNLTLLYSVDSSYGAETKTFTTDNGETYYVYIAHYSYSSNATGNFTISRSCVGALDCDKTIPYTYGFEDATDFNCWTTENCETCSYNSSLYGRYYSSSYAHTGSYSFVFSSYCGETDPQYLISPVLSGVQNGVHVEFDYAIVSFSQGAPETFKVGYSTTNNNVSSFTWSEEITCTSSTYEHYSANFLGQVKYIAVQYTSADSYYLLLDDFLIEEAPSCLEPTNIVASNVTTTSATISWTAGGSETEWDIYFTTNPSDVPTTSTTPSFSGLTTNSFNTVTNNYPLTPASTYYVYVRSACSGSETSAWSTQYTFNTECDGMSLPYSETFEAGGLTVCWTTINESPVYMSVSVVSTNPYAGTYHLNLDRRTPDGTQIVVLPEVDAAYALSNCEISFYAMLAAGSTTGSTASGRTLTVGVMTDPYDVSTFVAVGSAVEPTSSYAQYTFDLSSYTGNGQYIAIKHDATSNGYTYIDNLEVKALRYVKHITGYTNNGGYYLIASPIGTVEPENVTNMITDDDDNNNRTYDLYRFDQNPSDGLEWRNYRQGTFNLNIGQGYLYAHRTDVDLVFFTGSAISESTYNVPLTKSASASGHEFPDWNLVGNPFADVAHIDGGHPFYTLDVHGAYTLVSDASTTIESMQGVFVVAGEDEESITFVKGVPSKKSPKVTLNVSKGTEAGVIDRAIVCFGETRQMPKFQLFKNSTKVYIPMEGKDYALVHGEEMGAMPVNFKAEENGTYSMNFSCENVGFAYLHLIDNKTGNDVDLLKTPSYSFEAKTTDYESRFKLVFATGDNSNDDNFAFFSNGSFVINNEGAAELQVIDLMGRILSSETINGCTNVNVNAAPGVYMLRLINGDNVKVQKVVVK